MMEAVRTSETLVDNHFTRQYIPKDNSEHNLILYYTKLLNLKSNIVVCGRSELTQNTVHSLMVCRVHVLLYNAAKHIYVLTLRSFSNYAKISKDFNLYMLFRYYR
jgi:hypothetical protein